MTKTRRSEHDARMLRIAGHLLSAIQSMSRQLETMLGMIERNADLSKAIAENASLDEARISMLEADVKKIKRAMP